MDHPATRPSKKRLGFPISAEALQALCHPDHRHAYHRPVMLPSDDLAAANGWLMLKAHKFALPAPDPATPAFLDRWDRAGKWRRDTWTDGHDWRPTDDIFGTLFRFGPKPVWEPTRVRYHLRRHPAALVGRAAIVPIALLQLVARLPRAEVRADISDHSQPLPFRFNGGRGHIANHAAALMGKQAVSVLPPKPSPLPPA